MKKENQLLYDPLSAKFRDRKGGVEIDLDKVLATLLGGAIGDAIGAPIEFDSLQQIRNVYGEEGITTFEDGSWGKGRITDDTQMMVYTLEAVIRSYLRMIDRGLVDFGTVAHHAYLRWLVTQQERPPREVAFQFENGFLLDHRELHQRRAPDNSCLTALCTAIEPPTTEKPINNSKGCGGIMRVAPVGIFVPEAFGLGVTAAAITHGHPTGYLCAGFFAHLLEQILRRGSSLEQAVDSAMMYMVDNYDETEYEEVAMAVHAALTASESDTSSPEMVESLGAGWIAEEALSIALYCALVSDNYRDGVLLAVNHSGDSDSTGMLTGNLLGALHGLKAIPTEWRDGVECAALIEEMTIDAFQVSTGEPDQDDLDRLFEKYPPN